LKQKGLLIEAEDLFIGATALQHPVTTGDRQCAAL
jgi:predicted nucleic acid-binding protein